MSQQARWFAFGLLVAGLIAWFDSQLEQGWQPIALALFVPYVLGVQIGKLAYHVGFYESWTGAIVTLVAFFAETILFTLVTIPCFDATFVAQGAILVMLGWAIVFVVAVLVFNDDVMAENSRGALEMLNAN